MAQVYPGTLNAFSNPAGTNTLPGTESGGLAHANQHGDANDAIEAHEAVLGTTAGTSVLKAFAAGDIPVRSNTSNVLQTNISGTVGILAGTVNILAGTFDNGVFGTPAITSGTVDSVVMGTPAVTGGTANSITLGTPTVVQPNASMTRTSTQAIGSGTITRIAYDSAEWDNSSMFNSGTITVPVAGFYLMSLTVAWSGNTAGRRLHMIYQNGTELYRNETKGVVNTSWANTYAVIGSLAASDTIEGYCYQSGAASLDLIYTAPYNVNRLQVTKIL